MPSLRFSRHLLPVLLLATLLLGCTGAVGSPTTTIEAYLNALAAKDTDQLTSLSCSNWEEQARQELRSFDASTITLKDLKCQENGQEGESTLVVCQGQIIASYGAENMIIDLASWIFKVVKENGEWRMCGYNK